MIETRSAVSVAAQAAWQRQYERNAELMAGYPVHSCSVPGNAMAEQFSEWLKPQLSGDILDVGCGPQPIPLYLVDSPLSRVSGVDPIDAFHPFTFRQALAEELPFDRASFDCVIAATTLDHVLDPYQALAEARRVLRLDGRLFVWATYWPGAVRYDPNAETVALLDDYHVYHLDRPWFEAAVEDAGFRRLSSAMRLTPYSSTFTAWEAL